MSISQKSKTNDDKVIAYFKGGHTAYDYYKANKKRCGRRQIQLTQSEQDFIQTHLELD